MADKKLKLENEIDEELDAFNPDDFDDEEIGEEELAEDEQENSTLLMHCKPVFNFQSIEFDCVINPNNPEDIDYMMSVYQSILNRLMQVAVDQPKQVYIPPKEELATESQKQTMLAHKIKFDERTCTIKQARKLITESLEKSRG